MSKEEKSKCCNADINIKGMKDSETICTLYAECTKCHLPCDIILKERKVWTINPKTRVVPNKKKKDWEKLTKKEIEYYRKGEDF